MPLSSVSISAARFCDPGLFQCDNSECVLSFQVCDGTADCDDNSDEKDCHLPCIEGIFKCKINGKCILERFLCDGDKNCGVNDDSDESDTVCCKYTKVIMFLFDLFYFQ